jgi:hypothetical protein
VLSVSVVVQPNTGMCEGFTDSNGDRRRRSIVLAPVKVRVEGGSFTLSWTCNLAESCHNKECFYAKSKGEKLGV